SSATMSAVPKKARSIQATVFPSRRPRDGGGRLVRALMSANTDGTGAARFAASSSREHITRHAGLHDWPSSDGRRRGDLGSVLAEVLDLPLLNRGLVAGEGWAED